MGLLQDIPKEVVGGWFSQFAFPAALLLLVLFGLWKLSQKFTPLLMELLSAHISLVKTLEKAVEKLTESQARMEETLMRVAARDKEAASGRTDA